MIRLDRGLAKQIKDAAEAAYPEECCGLLIGRSGPGADDCTVGRVVASANVIDGDRRQGFEIDPRLRLDMMRRLRGGDDRILGHYHSHPDHPAFPSETDRERAYEPELIWLIVGVERGSAAELKAHRFETTTNAFTEISLDTLE